METIKKTEWFASIPTLPKAPLVFERSVDAASCRIQLGEASQELYSAYLRELEANGFAKGEDYALDDNRYALRFGEKATVYLSYSAKSHELAFYAEEAGYNQYPPKGCDGKAEYEVTMWQLETDCLGTKQNGGMSYVFLTADGSFVIIDGGYPTETEADNLYKLLKEKTPAGKKTVISGWFISHMHGDHYGALLKFAPKYASEIDVKGFYYHFDIMPDWFRNPFLEAMSYWKNAARYGRLHTGMQYNFPGICFDVLYTKEDFDPANEKYRIEDRTNGNEHSTVWRATINGQRLLLLCDIQLVASDTMLTHLDDAILKSDIVQFSHHGYEGGTPELYQAIGAHTVLWPMNILSNQVSYGGLINCFKTWMNRSPNAHFPFGNSYVLADPNVKKFIVEGAGPFETTFPYTPEGERMPDIDAIFLRQNREYIETMAWLRDVPRPDAKKEVFGFAKEEQTCIFEYADMTEDDFNAYVATLEAAGFAKVEDYTLEANRYAMRQSEKVTVYVSYSAQNASIRLYAEEKDFFSYPERNSEAEGDFEVKLWQLPVDNRGSKENGGMSYVWQLADGSFFIIDGGYPTALEADNLYKFLKEKTPAGQKTVVTGWFISHMHGDHTGAVRALAPKYAEEIEVKAFLQHSRVPSVLRDAYAKWSEAAQYIRIHSGMEWNLPGLKMQVLYTQEDLLPKSAETVNDESTVLRFTVKGQRVLFLGDIQKQASDCMEKYLTPETLKSDVVQFAHHGYEGGTVDLYKKINAPTVLWPMNIEGFQETGYYIKGPDGHSLRDENGERVKDIPQKVFSAWMNREPSERYPWPNRYVVEAESTKKIIVGGEGLFEMTFPYTPTGDKLPDLDAIFEERKNRFLNE